jgi:hypothetical protein
MAKTNATSSKQKPVKKSGQWVKLEGSTINEWKVGETREYDEYLGFTPSEKENMSGRHKFKDAKGAVQELWDCAQLQRKLQECPTGAAVRLTYNGKLKGKTGTMYKDYDVEFKP